MLYGLFVVAGYAPLTATLSIVNKWALVAGREFYDAHGVAGVRHPATKQLSLPKKKR